MKIEYIHNERKKESKKGCMGIERHHIYIVMLSREAEYRGNEIIRAARGLCYYDGEKPCGKSGLVFSFFFVQVCSEAGEFPIRSSVEI